MTRAGLARRPLACDMLRGLRRISTKRRGVEVMAYTYEELKHKTVAELRDIAAGIEHEALQGYTQLTKDHLLHARARSASRSTSTTTWSASTRPRSSRRSKTSSASATRPSPHTTTRASSSCADRFTASSARFTRPPSDCRLNHRFIGSSVHLSIESINR